MAEKEIVFKNLHLQGVSIMMEFYTNRKVIKIVLYVLNIAKDSSQ